MIISLVSGHFGVYPIFRQTHTAMLKTCFFAIEGDGHECIDRDFSYTHAAMTRNQQEGCNLTMAPQWTNGTSSWFPPLDLWPLLVYLFEVSNTRNKQKNPRFLQTVEEREAAAAAAVPARSALRAALAESPGSVPWTRMEGWRDGRSRARHFG